ncbi:MAG: DNA polymerase IV, partial [Planctomycetes bacterium]|nr:DNA polymerase IV [Planctomycetota bacterium]
MTLWRRAILHVDMDAFYASVEQLDNPELRGKPVIVGGDAKSRGVVSAASYEVRPYGVRSAMPMAKAVRLCPHAIRVKPRMERYAEVSSQIFAIFAKVTPLVQPISLDEAFLDVTGCQRLHGDPVTIAKRIRLSIKQATGLTASVGVATCRFVAKIASDLDKPDGLTIIPEEEMLDRLAPLPVSKIWGVGPVTVKKLTNLGIKTIGDVRQWPVEQLEQLLGQAGADLHLLANGIDDSQVVSEEQEKSISHETTFAEDVMDKDIL